jgi:hypothetical protein
MKNCFPAFGCVVLLFSLLVNSQGQTPASLETDNVFTGGNTFAQRGVYKGSGVHNVASVFLNGYTESNPGIPITLSPMTNGISVGGITPPDATVINITGISTRMTSNCNSYLGPPVNSYREICNTVGGYFVAQANANGAAVWALNPIVQDFAGISNATLQGEEIDMALSGTPTFVRGIAILAGGSGTPPTDSIGVEISGAMKRGMSAFNRGLTIDSGAASLYGIQIGAILPSGTNLRSMPLAFSRFDGRAMMHNDVLASANALGDFVLTPASGRALISGGALLGSNTASNTDLNGQLTFSASRTTAFYTFTGTYISAPICTFAPLADPGADVRLWISTLNTTTLQLSASTAITLTVDYQCSKRN